MKKPILLECVDNAQLLLRLSETMHHFVYFNQSNMIFQRPQLQNFMYCI